MKRCVHWFVIGVLSSACFFSSATFATPYTKGERLAFQRSIVDYRSRLNPRFKKVKRKSTRYIIIHTSEGGLRSTLKSVSQGKRLHTGQRTHGGHAHYVIARNGRTYRTMDKRYLADHAGQSMWNAETDISSCSVGIELVGYHYTNITDRQYRALGSLIEILQEVYHLDDRDVLTHSQIAYGKPNRWVKKNHRGRKRCAKNFQRDKARLGPTWPYDPDVTAGRLVSDPQLAAIFYDRKVLVAGVDESNIISKHNTAWSIAGEDFDSSTTIYKFPNGRIFHGDQLEAQVGWNRIPPNTVVLLNQENGLDLIKQEGPIKTITNGLTAWSIAASEYNKESTIYFLPSGRVKDGTAISDWDDLPSNTHLIIGYRGPYPIHKNRTAYRIAGLKYQDKKTIYYFPSRTLFTGDRIKDFSRLPIGTLVFLPSL